MKKIIVVIDRDRMLSAVYPALPSKQKSQVHAVRLAIEYAKSNDPGFKGKITLSNESFSKDCIVLSFERVVVNGR